ncbi:IclR family transcriptional regulator [Bradyrhizobium sp. USDA 3315]
MSYQNRSLARGFDVLECIRQSPRPLRMVDIADKVGLHTATAYRMLAVLTQMGYIKRDQRDRYVLNYRIFRLANSTQRSQLLRDTAKPILLRLAQEVKGAIQLGELLGEDVVIHERILTNSGDRDVREAFKTLPTAAHASAIGKLLLAYRGDKQFATTYQNRLLRQFTSHTITDPRFLQRHFSYMRSKKGCCDFEEAIPGVASHAAPVFDQEGTVVCAIAVSDWSSRINRDTLPQIAPRLRKAADEIGKLL